MELTVEPGAFSELLGLQEGIPWEAVVAVANDRMWPGVEFGDCRCYVRPTSSDDAVRVRE